MPDLCAWANAGSRRRSVLFGKKFGSMGEGSKSGSRVYCVPCAKIRQSVLDFKCMRHFLISLKLPWWRLDPSLNIERLRPHWQTRASTLCRILLRLHFPLPAEPIDYQSHQERGLLRSNNNLAADGSEPAPQLKNRGLPFGNFGGDHIFGGGCSTRWTTCRSYHQFPA